MLNMVALALMPKASTPTTAAANAGVRAMTRKA
jgi:hypothetical protein